MAIREQRTTSTFSGTATSDTLITSMNDTGHGGGDFLCVSTIQFDYGVANNHCYVSVYVNGVQITGTEVIFYNESSHSGSDYLAFLHSHVSPTSGQAVEVRYRVENSASNFNAYTRSMQLIPYASANFSSKSSDAQAQTSSTSSVVLTGMQFTGAEQPSSGTYVTLFSGDSEESGNGGQYATFSAFEGGTIVTHSDREVGPEGSLDGSTNLPAGLVTLTTPNGSQDVDIRWKVNSSTFNNNHRRLTLLKVDSGDVDSALASSVTNVTNTADATLNSMTVADPGADDWLALFTASGGWDSVNVAPGNDTYNNFYNAGTKVTNTDEMHHVDESIDSWPHVMPMANSAVITVAGATDDVDVRHRQNDTDQLSIYGRGLVLVREASADGSVVVTPTPASAVMVTVNPTVVLGSQSITPAAASAVVDTVNPTVVLGSVSVAPAAATAVVDTVNPTVILGSVTVTPTDANAVVDTVTPTVVLGDTIAAPAAASAVVLTVDPTVVLGSQTITPVNANAVVLTVDPDVTIGGIVVTPTASSAIVDTVPPTVVLGSISITPTSANAVVLTVDPTVAISGEADAMPMAMDYYRRRRVAS
jgi:hypothetical protein